MNFDWTKYKRVFAFGCSFTNYIYPTWADIIAQEIDGEFFNFGKSGMGNLAISSRIAEANSKFKFNETDLVLVMYSTIYREDRWLEGTWQSHGNIFNQCYYDKSFVKKYVDTTGCLIRDLAMIELSTQYVKSLPCTSLLFKSTPFNNEGPENLLEDEISKIVKETYSDLWNSFPESLYEVVAPNGWNKGVERISEGNRFIDNHPTPIEYYTYLKHIGLNLSEKTKEYVIHSDKLCRSFEDLSDWMNYFPELDNRQRIVDRLVF